MLYTNQQIGRINKIIIAIIFLIGWVALIGQLYLILLNRKLSIPETILQYFSYFTILSNLLVTIACTVLLFKPTSTVGKFFYKPTTLTALTVYITIVGLVYNVILRFLWAPQGLQKLVDELLHTVMPLLFITYWFIYVPKSSLKWNKVYLWLLFPLIYCIYILLRGALTGLYPYPFIDVRTLGYNNVFINIALLVIAFLFTGLFFIGIGKLSSKIYLKTNKLH